MGIIDAIIGGTWQRMQQHQAAADASLQAAHQNPTPGNVAGAFKDTVLGTLLGLPMEAAQSVGNAVGGAALVGGAAIDRATGYPTDQRRQTDEAILQAGLLHPLAAMEAAQHGPDSDVAHLAGGLGMLANPLNYTAPIGRLGSAIELAGKAPALGTAIKNTALVGELINRAQLAPLAAVPGARRALLTLPEYARPAAAALDPATNPVALPAVRDAYRGLDQRLADAAARDNAIAATGLDPNTAAGSRALASGYKAPAGPPVPTAAQLDALPVADLLRQGPGTAPLPGRLAALNLPPDVGAWIGRATDNTLRDLPLGTGAAQTPRRLDPLAMQAREALRPEDARAISDLRLPDAAPEVSAPLTPDLPTAPETGAPIDRYGVVRDLANGPVTNLTAVLKDLHNAVYPNGASRFASRALTGIDPTGLHVNDLIGHPDGNAAEPYLDYLIGRVQTDPKAAARLAGINEGLHFDIADLPAYTGDIGAHREELQALFGAGKFGAETPIGGALGERAAALAPVTADVAPALSDAPHTGTLDDMRSLILGERDRVGTVYPPNDPAFYQSRANVDPAHVPGMLRQLADEGTLGFDPIAGFAVKDAARLPEAGTPATDLPSLSGAQDAPAAIPDVQARGKQAIRDLFADAADDKLTPVAPGRLYPAIAGQLGGAALGGAAGFTQGDTTQERLQNAAKGAAAGALVGGSAGMVAPELAQVTHTAIRAIATAAPGLVDDTILSPEVQRIALDRARAAQGAAAGMKGAKLADIPAALDNQWRAQTTATAKNLTQDAGTIRLLVSQFGDEFATDQATVRATLGQLARNIDHADPVIQAGDLGKTLDALGQTKLLIPTGASDTANGLHNLLGVDMVTNAVGKGAQPNAPQRVAAGAAIGLANAVTRVSPLSPLVGAARGYFAPWADAYFGTLNGLQHDAPRVAFLQGALNRDLPQLANDFLGDLAAQGVNVKPLEQLAGRFGGQDVKATLLTSGQTALATQAGKDWDTLTEALIRGRSDRIAHLFGDFRDSANGTAVKGIGRVFPFATWAIKYAPVLAEIAARHPRVTAGIGGALVADAAQAQQDGRPAYQVGMIPISTETPLLGAGARVLLGGQSGTARVNPLGLLSPYGGQTVASGLGDTPLDSATTPYQHIMNYANIIGLSPHPLIQAGAYVTGQDFKGPNSLSRTAGLEQLPQLLPGPLGATMPSMQNTLDAARNLISGQGSTAQDPAARRFGELVLATTGKPLADPTNSAYLDPNNPQAQALHDRATREAILSGAARNAYSFTSPLAATAQGTEAQAASKARGIVTEAQNYAAHLPAGEKAALQQRITAYQQAHPETLVYDGATKQALAQLRLAAWERQNATLRAVPELYNVQREIVMENLGLAAPGGYANQVRQLQLQDAQPGRGQLTLMPGVPFSGTASSRNMRP